jgi:hypothetical protein
MRIQATTPGNGRIMTSALTAPNGQRQRVTVAWAVAMAALMTMLLNSTPGLVAALSRLDLPAASHAATAPAPKHAPSTRAFRPAGAATFTLINRHAGLTGTVTAHGLAVRTAPSAPVVALRSVALGRPATSTVLAAATPTATDETAALRHGDVVEWFQNNTGSLEQGWTLAHRPAGRGPLSLSLAITGAAVSRPSATALSLIPATGRALAYDHLVVRDARGHVVPAHFERSRGGARIVIDDTHATYPLVVDPDLAAVATINGPANGGNSQFGDTVKVVGTWMAVGEQVARNDNNATPGRIELFHDSTGNGTWQFVTTVDPYDQTGTPINVTAVGRSLSLLVEPSGITVIAGASNSAIVWTLPGAPEGAALTAKPVFVQQIQSSSLPAAVRAGMGDLGAALDASGDTLVIGAPQSGASNTCSSAGTPVNEREGLAEVLTRTAGFGSTYAWSSELLPPGSSRDIQANRDANQWFGSSIAYDATDGLIAVGAIGDDGVQTAAAGSCSGTPSAPGTSNFNGAVDMFRLASGTWSRVARLTSSTNASSAKFGSSLAFAGGGTLLVGAPVESAAYLFNYNGTTTWTQVQRMATAGVALGTSVASNPAGTRLYVGATSSTQGAGLTGSVQVFQRSTPTGAATAVTTLVPATASTTRGGIGQAFGGAVAATGNAVMVGAPLFGDIGATGVGRLTTFGINGTTYSLIAELSPVEHEYHDQFGAVIARDGDTIAVSMPDSSRNIGGPVTSYGLGAVGIFRWVAGAWTLDGVVFPNSVNAVSANAGWGHSVALHVYRDASGNDIGLVVAIGAPFNADGTNSANGSVGLYYRNGGPGTAYQTENLYAGGQAGSSNAHEQNNANFGAAVGFTTDGTLYVGEPGANSGTGRVERYERLGTPYTWTYQDDITPTAGPAALGFGQTIAVDGSQMVVTSADSSSAAPYNTTVRRYVDGGTASDPSVAGFFDTSLADSGVMNGDYTDSAPQVISASIVANRIAIGSTLSHAARVYRIVNGVAVREADESSATNPNFGFAVDLDHSNQNTLIVGAPYTGFSSSSPGEAYLYVVSKRSDGSGQWSAYGQLTNPNPGTGWTFGSAVSDWASATGGVLVGDPFSWANQVYGGELYRYDASGVVAPAGPQAFVDLTLPTSMQVGATQVRTSDLSPSLLTQQGQDGSVAATPIGSIDMSQAPAGTTVDASPLHSIPLHSIPLHSIPLASIPLASIPLQGVDGGWAAVLAGTPFADLPLQSVLLSDVYDLPSVQALPLGALSLAGSPLASIPLASIALGATPLHSIPLDNSGTDPIVQWCAALAAAGADTTALGLDCANPGDTANNGATMLSIGVRGAPLASIPLHSIPLHSIDLSGAPLASIPLHSIAVAGSPLASIPLHSINIAGTPLASIPLHSIPLHSIPLASIPLASITLDGTPLASIPLHSIDIAGSPLHSIPLHSIPLASIPLHSIPLASIPLHSIPLASIPLASITLGSTPLASIPLASIDIAGTPLHSIPLHSIPLASIPLASIPLASIPLHSIPLHSIPLHSITINGSPLASIPLHSIDIADSPLHSIPLHSIASPTTVVDCTLVDCTSTTLTLGDALAAGALLPGATLADIEGQLGGVRLSDLIGANGISADQLRSALGSRSLADLSDFDNLTLGELPQIYPYLVLSQVANLAPGIRLGDLAGHLLEFTADQLAAAVTNSALTLADVTGWDNVTLGETQVLLQYLQLGDLTPGLSGLRLEDLVGAIQKPGGGTYSEDDLRAALEATLGANATLSNLSGFDDLTLGELGQYGSATLGDLLSALTGNAADGITLADLLLALVNPKQYPWDALDMSAVTAQALTENPSSTPVTVAYRANAPDGLPRTVEVTVQMPAGARYVPGSATGTFGSTTDLTPAVDGTNLVWTLHGVPANAVQSLSFGMQAPLAIGPVQLTATTLLPNDDATASDTASSTVTDGLEPNDTLASATPLPDDTVMLSQISTSSDIDVYKFDVTQPGTRVSINLSNLDADLDMVLYAPRSGTMVPTSNRSIDPVEDNQSGSLPGATQSGTSTEQATPGDDHAHPADLGSLATVQGSFNRGRQDEEIDTGVLTQTGTYYLAVTGYNGATDVKPYALRLKRFTSNTQPSCPARTVTPGTIGTSLPASLPDGTNTVFVVDPSRMSGLYGAAASDTLMGQLNDFVTWLQARPALGVNPTVLTVDADQSVRDAYAQWDASPCLPSGANGVVSQIARILNGYRSAGAALKNVVIVGGDDVIPFGRVPDRTSVANELGYSSTFADGPGNALYATFATSSLQTDNVYVDRAPYAFGDRTLYVPDATVGRLVELPTEIGAQLTDFEHAGGKLAAHTGLVTGYDFLSDGAQAVAGDLSHTYGSVDSHLISETWTRQDLENAIDSIKPNVLSINAHFDHYRSLPGAGNTTGDESDLFQAAAVRGSLNGDLAGSIVFSMGCHSGLSASDLLLPTEDVRALDFAQAVSSQGGVFVGNTGFGYGDTDTVALSEQLMNDFAQRLDGSMSIGDALLYAKNAYFSGTSTFTPYDEKVLQETTFYGLPFYQLDVAAPPVHPAPPSPTLTTDPATGLLSTLTHLQPTYVTRTADNGTTYVAAVDPTTGQDGLTTVQNRPVEPKVDSTYAQPQGEAPHDALVLGMSSTDTAGTDPYVFKPIVDDSGERVDTPVDTAFPTKPVQVNPGLAPSGPTYDVAATTGYFRTTKADGTGIQRTYNTMDLVTYFAPPGNTDFTAPVFGSASAQLAGGTLSVDAHVTDDQGGANGVTRVRLLAVVDPRSAATTTWAGIDLVRTPGSDEWSGSLPAAGTHVEYILQAVDAAGNVGVSSDKADNYAAGPSGSDTGPAPAMTISLAGTLGGAGWYRGPVTVTATGGRDLVYEVIGETGRIAYQGPFTVSGDGLHNVHFTSVDGQDQTVTVPIDTVGPTAQLLAPGTGQAVPASQGFLVSYQCPDAGSGAASCTGTVDGSAVASGSVVKPAAGTHTIVVTPGPDRAGNPPSGPAITRTILVVGPPTVGAIGIAKATDGTPTTATASFAGYSGFTYSAVISWGDGSTSLCGTAGSNCSLVQNANGTGTVTGTHTYPVGTTEKTVTVTVSDQYAQSGASNIVVNRQTKLSATPAVLQIKAGANFISVKSGAISATLTDAANNPLPNQTIRFTLPTGLLICTAVTGANGTATCSSVTFTIGTILSLGYIATYNGHDVYRGSTASAGLIGP